MLNVNHSEPYGTANFGHVQALKVFMASMMLGKELELPRQETVAQGSSSDAGEASARSHRHH